MSNSPGATPTPPPGPPAGPFLCPPPQSTSSPVENLHQTIANPISDGLRYPQRPSVQSNFHPSLLARQTSRDSGRHQTRRRIPNFNRQPLIKVIKDNAILDLGEAIRSGNVALLVAHIENNGLGQVFTARFAFEIVVRQLGYYQKSGESSKRKGRYKTPGASSFYKPAVSKTAVMEVTALQLAVVSRQLEMVKHMLDTAVKSDDESDRQALLRGLTAVHFPDSANMYESADQMLHGLNAFQLAARYHSEALELFMDHLGTRDPNKLCELTIKPASNVLEHFALHMAACNPDPKSLSLLLNYGSEVDIRDERYFTPLHMSAKCSLEENVLMLLENGADPNAASKKDHVTPLHRSKSTRVVQTLLHYGADPTLSMNSSRRDGTFVQRTALDILVDRNPVGAKVLLDDCIFTNGQDLTSKHLVVVFDLELLSLAEQTIEHGEMTYHNKVVSGGSGMNDLLEHPISEAFLQLKYQLVRPHSLFNVSMYLSFTVCLTLLAVVATAVMAECDTMSFGSLWPCLKATGDFYRIAFFVLFLLTGMGTLMIFLRELAQAYTNWYSYWSDPENWLECFLIFSTIGYMVSLSLSASTVAPHFGSLAVLTAWLEFTLLIGRFPSIGIYIFMSVHVLKLMGAFFMFFASIMFGFAMAFHMLLPNHTPFDNLFSSIAKVMVMMSGEFEYEDNFLWTKVEESGGSNGTAQLVFILFYFVISIVISNLIIGLTVNETEELFKTAGVMRVQKTVQQIMVLEDVLIKEKSVASKLLPRSHVLVRRTQLFPYLYKVNEADETVPPGYKICIRPHQKDRYQPWWRAIIPFKLNLLVDDSDHFIYLFNETECAAAEARLAKFTLPDSLVQKTLSLLRAREADGLDYASPRYSQKWLRRGLTLDRCSKIMLPPDMTDSPAAAESAGDKGTLVFRTESQLTDIIDGDEETHIMQSDDDDDN